MHKHSSTSALTIIKQPTQTIAFMAMLFNKYLYKPFLISFLLINTVMLNACMPVSDLDEKKQSQLQRIKGSGELRVGTVYNPLSYFFGANDNASGFDYELAEQFAQSLGVKLKIVASYNATELSSLLENNSIDFIASQFQNIAAPDPAIKLSPQLYTVNQIVAYKTGTFRPKNFSLVDDVIWLVQGSSQEQLMREIALKYPNIKWQVTADADEEELLRKVSEQEIKYALVDSHNLSLNQRFYPLLARAIIVKKATSVHWQLKTNTEDSLQAALISFIGQQYASGELSKLKDKYFGQFIGFDYVDTRAFLKAIKKTLPKYEALFRKYAGNMDWRLLASVSYQESHWRPKAKSPTGVRGMMMLTNTTAKEVNVTNRLDPEQSISGGVRYLEGLVKRLPATIHKDEIYWFALASYNIGFGHLMDARRLTKLRGQNPDSWSDVKKTLPLLMQRRWNRKTRYGYARGGEAAAYVLNIRQYFQSLVWQDALNEKNKAIAEQNLKFKKLIAPAGPENIKQTEENPMVTPNTQQQVFNAASTNKKSANKELVNSELSNNKPTAETPAQKATIDEQVLEQMRSSDTVVDSAQQNKIIKADSNETKQQNQAASKNAPTSQQNSKEKNKK